MIGPHVHMGPIKSLFSLRYTWKTRWIPVIKLNVFSFFPKVHSPEKPETASVETDWTTWFVLIRRPGHVIVIIVIMDLHWHETSAPAFKDQTSCCFKQQSGFTTHPGLLQCTRNFWTRLHFVHIWNWFPLVFLFSHLFCNLRQNLNEHLAASLGWVCSRLTIPADHTQLMSIRCPAQRNVTQKHPTVQTTAVQCDSEASSYWTNNTLCAAPEFGRSS